MERPTAKGQLIDIAKAEAKKRANKVRALAYEEARGLLRDSQGPQAVSAFEDFIYKYPRFKRAYGYMAQALTMVGRHADSIAWYRRALDVRPESKSTQRALAHALLIRGHWDEGRKYRKKQNQRRDLDIPDWDGKPLGEAPLLAYHRPEDPLELSLIGLGLLSALADEGHTIICECPRSLFKLAEQSLKGKLKLKKSGTPDLRAKARIPLADLMFLPNCKLDGPSSWFSAPKSRKKDEALTLGYVGVFEPNFIDNLHHETGANFTEIKESLSAHKMAESFMEQDGIISTNGMAALLAAACGRPVIHLRSAKAGWWWGDEDGRSLWYKNLRTLENPTAQSDLNLAQQIAYLIGGGLPNPQRRPSIRPKDHDPLLGEALDRLAPHLPHATPLTRVKPLTGGSRNAVYRLTYPGGDLVMRLGKFPPQKGGFFNREIVNMSVAHQAGLAPKLHYANPLDGDMLSEFLSGGTMRPSHQREKGMALAIARLFRKLHALPAFEHKFDIFDKLEWNFTKLNETQNKDFLAKAEDSELILSFKGILAENNVPLCPTHNDPQAANFVATDNGPMLIDWESSAMSDPHWEITALSAQVGLSDDIQDAYLTEYFGSDAHPAKCRIPLYSAICKFYWWTRMVRKGPAETDQKEWRKSADNWFNLYRQEIHKETFEENLIAAKSYRWTSKDAL